MTPKQTPKLGYSIFERETAELTIAACRAHAGMLRRKSGDAADVAKSQRAIVESHKSLADANKEPPRLKKNSGA